jgi:hypothetical protein
MGADGDEGYTALGAVARSRPLREYYMAQFGFGTGGWKYIQGLDLAETISYRMGWYAGYVLTSATTYQAGTDTWEKSVTRALREQVVVRRGFVTILFVLV